MATKRLLVIDDERETLTLIEFALHLKTNWQIITASSGIEGISKAEQEQPDVILLDVLMPDLDGMSVCDLLKSNIFTCAIPVIFMTAMTHPELLSSLETSWALGVITKPFDVIGLDEQIAKVCEWHPISKAM